MPERDDPYSNPLPPPGHEHEDAEAHPMTNADFRKLLMTPRAPSASVPTSAAQTTLKSVWRENEREQIDDRMSSRKKKKSFYAKLKKQEEDKMAELARKYRDRAKERQEGDNPDYQNVDLISSTAGYRAVAPDAKSGMDAAERRRQLIQESKFLGGDMEHTHLVKGLDYALLQKVRSEIMSKEQSEEEEMNEVFKLKPKDRDAEEEEQMQFKTKIAKSVFRVIFKNRYPERNELFLPGRMAYVIDLEDEYAESDIPTTLIRSKADCPSLESQTTLTTNDIVINKLTQILSYLRQGMRGNKKIKKKDRGKLRDEKNKEKADDGIYPELGDYLPSFSKPTKEKGRDRNEEWDQEREREKERKYKSYFEKPSTEDDRDRDREHSLNARELVKSINEKFAKSGSMDPRLAAGWAPADISLQEDQEFGINPKDLSQEDKSLSSTFKKDDARLKLKAKLDRSIPDSYAECYPGAPETEDAAEDSDDEVDYTKMDMGNKKGPVGRWDFDTQEEYSDYMNTKEALPKAAFQYGVKMADGRKTRRAGTGKKDEKAELDRQWQQISRIIAKRKAEENSNPGYKRPKY